MVHDCVTCDEITSFMGGKTDVDVELRWLVFAVWCNPAFHFSIAESLNEKQEGHKPVIHEYARCSKRQFKEIWIHWERQTATGKVQI